MNNDILKEIQEIKDEIFNTNSINTTNNTNNKGSDSNTNTNNIIKLNFKTAKEIDKDYTRKLRTIINYDNTYKKFEENGLSVTYDNINEYRTAFKLI